MERSEAVKEFFLAVGRLIYTVKDIIVLVIMSIVGLYFSPTTDDKLSVAFCALILFWMCIELRRIPALYACFIKKKTVNKRFVHLDDNGNPSIRTEDLPEIIEYLYRLEEAENGNRSEYL